MKKTKKLTALFCLLLACICLCSCGAESAAGISLHSEIEGVLTTDYFGLTVSAMENGIFSCDSGTLKFHAFPDGKSYVLCSNPNCKHNTADCAAYAPTSENVTGLGMYKDRVYFFKNDVWDKRGTVEFVSMKPDGTDVRIVKELEKGDAASGEVMLYEVTDAVYANGMALCKADYRWEYEIREDSVNRHIVMLGGIGLMAINLESGETTVVKEGDPFVDAYYIIQDVNGKYAAVEYGQNAIKRLTLEEFERDEGLKNKHGDYRNYLQSLSESGFDRIYGGILINLDTFETTDLFEEVAKYDDAGIPVVPQADCIYGLSSEEVIIFKRYDYDGVRFTREELIGHNIESGEERSIIKFDQNEAPFWTTGLRHQSCLFDNETKILLRGMYIEGKTPVGYLDLKTGETVHMYDDKEEYEWMVNADLKGEYDDYLLLSKYKTHGTMMDFYLIAKDDYLSGNLSKAKKIY